ncbi:MAG: N-acetylmuramoyl-L-alanine amidase [Candidatus Sabulitectum sp.]|nr:N-acetylmuramoyl-L-alanine amidase [Candidatus Sabulitectum sp.]
MIFLFKLLSCFIVAGITICLDPGHGGTSTGAVGEYALEKDVVLEVALRVHNWLNQVSGVSFVALTRDGDYNVSLLARSGYANSWGFDYFISIHENAFNGAVQGTETFCCSLDPEDTSYQLAVPVQNSILDAYDYTDRGVKDGSHLHVIRETSMPAILGEGSFLDYDLNWNESYLYAFNVNDHLGIQTWAYADGICEFLGLSVPACGNGVILMDNLSPGFAVDDSLKWSEDASGAPWMLNCVTAEVGPDRTASWTSMIPVNGSFTVESWWTSGNNRSSSVCYRIFHSEGYTDIFVDQFAGSGGGEWVFLGSFSFDGECSVQILGSQSFPGVMVADAVKLVPPLGIEQFEFTGLSVVRNPASSFTFLLPSSTVTEVLIYNSAGRRVSTLRGTGSIEWIPADQPQGVYFAVETDQFRSIKLVYIKSG